jgi:hypothetical protein
MGWYEETVDLLDTEPSTVSTSPTRWAVTPLRRRPALPPRQRSSRSCWPGGRCKVDRPTWATTWHGFGPPRDVRSTLIHGFH